MKRKILEVFDEFCDRLEEPGSLVWRAEWEEALYQEVFCDYPRILVKENELPSLQNALDKGKDFSGFVNLDTFNFKLNKLNVLALNSISSKFQGEFGYLKDNFFKYLQSFEKNKLGILKTLFFINDNFYTQRIYSSARKDYSELFYFANHGLFNLDKYSLGFSQYNSSFFNLYMTKEGTSFPLLKFEMDSSFKISKELINNVQIFSDFETFHKLMKNRKCRLFTKTKNGTFINNGGSIEANSPVLKFEKALKLL